MLHENMLIQKELPINTNQRGNVKYLNLLTSFRLYIECNVEIPPEVLEDCNSDGETTKTGVSGLKIFVFWIH
jgi:hypothetical protein